jgi:hypothetical protein
MLVTGATALVAPRAEVVSAVPVITDTAGNAPTNRTGPTIGSDFLVIDTVNDVGWTGQVGCFYSYIESLGAGTVTFRYLLVDAADVVTYVSPAQSVEFAAAGGAPSSYCPTSAWPAVVPTDRVGFTSSVRALGPAVFRSTTPEAPQSLMSRSAVHRRSGRTSRPASVA